MQRKNDNNHGERSKSHVVANMREELQMFSQGKCKNFLKIYACCYADEKKDLCVYLKEDKTRTTELKL